MSLEDNIKELVIKSDMGSEFTPTPNILVEKIMAQITPIEVCLYLIVQRKTKGWHKPADKIALSQFVKLSGVSQSAVWKGLQNLIKVGLIEKISTDFKVGCEYRIASVSNTIVTETKLLSHRNQPTYSQKPSSLVTETNTKETNKETNKEKQTKVYSKDYLKDIQVIRDNTTKRMKVIDKLYIKYCKSVKLFGQDYVSNAIIGYASDEFFSKGSKGEGKWNFEKLLNNETNLDMYAEKGKNIKPKSKIDKKPDNDAEAWRLHNA